MRNPNGYEMLIVMVVIFVMVILAHSGYDQYKRNQEVIQYASDSLNGYRASQDSSVPFGIRQKVTKKCHSECHGRVK